MQFLLAVTLVLATVMAQNDPMEELGAKFRQVGGQCKTEVGATDDDIATLKAHNLPTTTTGKCFLACVQQKLEFLTSDGKFNRETIAKFVEKSKDYGSGMHHKLQHVVDTCLAKVTEGGDPCEVALNAVICARAEMKTVGLPQVNW